MNLEVERYIEQMDKEKPYLLEFRAEGTPEEAKILVQYASPSFKSFLEREGLTIEEIGRPISSIASFATATEALNYTKTLMQYLRETETEIQNAQSFEGGDTYSFNFTTDENLE